MSGVRIPAVAGLFYPADHETLEKEVDAYLAAATTKSSQPKAIISPHAGYKYSGAIAASAYKILQGVSEHIKHIILLGPSHRVPLMAWRYPLVTIF